jgi:hypothetical protein
MLSTDHIVVGGKRMRLVAMQQYAGTPAGKETFSTVPIDGEGNDVMDEEASADSSSSPRKRKKVRCFDNLVTVEKGAARSRCSEDGWEYTWEAKRNQFLHEASGGHATCTRESQRSRLDAERRMIARDSDSATDAIAIPIELATEVSDVLSSGLLVSESDEVHDVSQDSESKSEVNW